ncbi:MAG TPA: hypothetical protein PKC18_17800 [Lacipirellulaceae bacterium]|nr:hypothetical protein [Lacipirellulaceae bacterium]HMP06476.1 hypothetical protein [Lacipirellulaceae bacterium]
MNARNLVASLLALLVLGAGIAEARPTVGTPKARGAYNEFSAPRSVRSMARSRPSYRYRYSTPTSPSAPMIVQAPTAAPMTPQVAQALAEARRYSYAPATGGAVTTSPCPTTTVPQAGRRYSYAPSETSVAPAPTYAPRAYSSRPSFSGRSRGGSTSPNFPLPKTDPRKYYTR